MTSTSKTSESKVRVPFGWDAIEGDEDVSFNSETKSKPSSLLEKENTSSFSAESQANSHIREAGQE